MSEPIPESIPTSSSRLSNRPNKKQRSGPITPLSQQTQQVEALFANPDREIVIPNAGDGSKRTLAPPEIVTNVQGSSAGAGSGEFHVYKASRRREYERLRIMDEEVARENADEEFRARQESLRAKDEEALERNRAKREKAKARKAKAKLGGAGAGDIKGSNGAQDGQAGGVGMVKRKLGAAKTSTSLGKETDDTRMDDQVADEATQEDGFTIHDDD